MYMDDKNIENQTIGMKIYDAMKSAFPMIGYSFSGELLKPSQKKKVISIFDNHFNLKDLEDLEDLEETKSFQERLDQCLKNIFDSEQYSLDGMPRSIDPEKNNSQYSKLKNGIISKILEDNKKKA